MRSISEAMRRARASSSSKGATDEVRTVSRSTSIIGSMSARALAAARRSSSRVSMRLSAGRAGARAISTSSSCLTARALMMRSCSKSVSWPEARRVASACSARPAALFSSVTAAAKASCPSRRVLSLRSSLMP